MEAVERRMDECDGCRCEDRLKERRDNASRLQAGVFGRVELIGESLRPVPGTGETNLVGQKRTRCPGGIIS